MERLLSARGLVSSILPPRGYLSDRWYAAGAVMNRMRVLVATNLLFGALTIVAAMLGTYLGR